MKVFISWSGERSKMVARALRQWFPRVFQSVEPWMSEKDIIGGSLWLNEIMEGLKGARFGVVCVTPENQDKPWIHFEAGAIAKAIDSQNYVCPYLIFMQGFELQHNPLTNFQYKQADKKGTQEFVESMNQVLDKPLPQDDLQETFELWWPRLYEKLSEMPKPAAKQVEKRSVENMVEEVLELVRGLVRSTTPPEKTKFLDQFPYEAKTVLQLRYIEGLTDRKIAKVLEISPSTVSRLMARAQRMVREELSHIDERNNKSNN